MQKPYITAILTYLQAINPHLLIWDWAPPYQNFLNIGQLENFHTKEVPRGRGS